MICASRLVRLTAAALVLLIPIGCRSASSAAHAPPSIAGDEVRMLLLDSWVTDGRRGFFVDGAHSTADPPFSLYETLWQLRIVARAGAGTAGVLPGSVRAWIGGALSGRLANSGLPEIAQVDYAVQVLELVDAPPDKARVRQSLDRLRSGGRYRAGVSAKAGDWGSTAVAVRVQAALGLSVPSAVVAEATRMLTSPDLPTIAKQEPTQVISLLEVAGDLGSRLAGAVPSSTLAGVVRAADRALAEARPDASWLASASSLRRAATRLGIETAPVDPGSCAHLVSGDGNVRLPGQSVPDPQATWHALNLGCRGARTSLASAHSRAGWPSQKAVDEGLAASAAGMRVAHEVRVDRSYAEPLALQARQVWLPTLRSETSAQTAGGQVDQANLKLVAALVGARLAHEVAAALPIPVVAEGAPGGDAAMLVSMVGLARSESSPQQLERASAVTATAATQLPETASIVRAAWLELAGQLFSDPQLHAKAVAEAGRLRIADGLYTPSRRTDADALNDSAASLTASVIGTWIERPATDVLAVWTRAALCTENRCAETSRALDSMDHMPMKNMAAVLAAQRRGHADMFPVAF